MLIRSILKYSVVLFGLFQLASPATLRCYYGSFTDYVDVPMESPGGLVTGSRPCLDITKPTVFVAIGFKYDPLGPLLTALITALLSLLNLNVVVVNWPEEAGDGGLGFPGYLLNCLPKSQLVGAATGKATADLVMNHNLNPNITTIGHSAGCSLLCVAANKHAEITGNYYSQAIMMDIARAGFDPPTGLFKVPDKTCAKRVMSSHCDPGGYAINKSVAHADFWINPKYFVSPLCSSRLQPGCTKSYAPQDVATNGNLCNHDYCWKTFVEAVYQTATFTGGMAEDYSAAADANGNFAVTNNYGLNWDPEKQGNFFLRTSATKPYGLGPAGLQGL